MIIFIVLDLRLMFSLWLAKVGGFLYICMSVIQFEIINIRTPSAEKRGEFFPYEQLFYYNRATCIHHLVVIFVFTKTDFMDISVNISASSVLPDVYKITGYTGQKAVQDKDMDRISSTSDDGSILGGFFIEACNSLGDVVSRFGYASSLSSSSVTYSLTLPANWKTGVQTSMTNAMKLYLVNGICKQWFNLSQKLEVAYYESQMAICADSIKKYLCERTKPTRN